MQETFIVSVQTEDGKLLIQQKIKQDCYGLLSLLLQRYLVYGFHSKDIQRLEIALGSGTGRSVSVSSLPTAS